MEIKFCVRSVILKNIEEKLEKVLERIASLLPAHLQQDFKQSAFIAGGCIYSLYNDKEPKDYDVFLTDKELLRKIKEYFNSISNLEEKSGLKMGYYKHDRLIVSDYAISVGNYQIITRFSGDVEEVVQEFDFKHNQFYYKNGKVNNYADWKYIETNQLYFNDDRPRDICGCICRVSKFLRRGMEISNSEMSKMLLKLNEVGFNERELEILNQFNKDFES